MLRQWLVDLRSNSEKSFRVFLLRQAAAAEEPNHTAQETEAHNGASGNPRNFRLPFVTLIAIFLILEPIALLERRAIPLTSSTGYDFALGLARQDT